MNKRTMVNLCVFVGVFVLISTWAVRNIVVIDYFENPYTIYGEFHATSGVQPNAEVAYLGVHYGRVTDVKSIPGGVRMTLKIDHNKEIPEHSIARIFRKSAIGEPYIDFNPPPNTSGTGPYIKAGSTVPMNETENPLEFSELLRSAATLLSHVDAEKAGSLIHELSDALVGRTDSLRQLMQGNDELAATFAAKTDVLDRLATNNTAITHVVATHAGDFGQSVTNLRNIADSLANAKGNTAILLEEGSQLVGQLADLVADEKGNIDCILHDLGDVTDMTSDPDRLAGTTFLLEDGAEGFGDVWKTRDQQPDGVWARVNLEAKSDNPATQYEPPHELPAVPAVPPCRSSIAPSHGPDFVPAAYVAPRPPVAVPVVVILLALAGFAVLVVVPRRSVFRVHHRND